MTTYYVSFNDLDGFSYDPAHNGTSSTAADLFEVRMGTAGANITHRQAINGMRAAIRFLIQGGTADGGSNLPPDRG